MALTGRITNRTELANELNNRCKNSISYVWHTGNHPTNSGTPNIWGSIPNIGASNISSGTMTASTCNANIVNFAKDYWTTVWNVRHIHRNQGDNSNILSDVTQRAVLNGSYKQNINPNLGLAMNVIIKEPGYQALINELNRVNGSQTYTFTTYQHASHSAHGSRARR